VFLAATVRLRVVNEEMPGAEVVHTFVATMRPDGESDGCAQASRWFTHEDGKVSARDVRLA
jgi:hypothetical protein